MKRLAPLALVAAALLAVALTAQAPDSEPEPGPLPCAVEAAQALTAIRLAEASHFRLPSGRVIRRREDGPYDWHEDDARKRFFRCREAVEAATL